MATFFVRIASHISWFQHGLLVCYYLSHRVVSVRISEQQMKSQLIWTATTPHHVRCAFHVLFVNNCLLLCCSIVRVFFEVSCKTSKRSLSDWCNLSADSWYVAGISSKQDLYDCSSRKSFVWVLSFEMFVGNEEVGCQFVKVIDKNIFVHETSAVRWRTWPATLPIKFSELICQVNSHISGSSIYLAFK